MKTIQTLLLATLILCFSHTGFAQGKAEKIAVSGACGMCKKKIEKAARNAGASFAEWNTETKMLQVEYGNGSNADKIQQSIAAIGYDTPKYRAEDAVYEKLHACCKYERTNAAPSQLSGATLQAGGLTCSMCSKAVNNALKGVAFVEELTVDIESQQYNLIFREGASVNLDDLKKAVEDAGFSVAKLMVTARMPLDKILKDDHIRIGGSYFHFLSGADQLKEGDLSFTVVDKDFVPAKEHKKYSNLSKMECIKTGKATACCTGITEHTRIYHVII